MEAATVFDDLNGWGSKSVSVTTDAGPEALQAGHATPGFLAMLGYGHSPSWARTCSTTKVPSAVTWPSCSPTVYGGSVSVRISTLSAERCRSTASRTRSSACWRLARPTQSGAVAAVSSRANSSARSVTFLPRDGTPEARRYARTGQRAHGCLRRRQRQAASPLPAAAAVRISVEPFRNNFVTDGTKAALWLLVGAVAFVCSSPAPNVDLLLRAGAHASELAVRLTGCVARRDRAPAPHRKRSAGNGWCVGCRPRLRVGGSIVALMPPFTLPTKAELAERRAGRCSRWVRRYFPASCSGALLPGRQPRRT